MHVRQALGFDELEYPKYSRMLVNQHHEMHTSVPYYTSSQSLENSILAFKVKKPQRNFYHLCVTLSIVKMKVPILHYNLRLVKVRRE